MANELKRVGLVFTQEGAVDFKKSLQEINLELNKNYNQFKLTQSQWDKSTKSTEKLRAEQEYLKNAYEIQADRVSTLKMQLSDLENAEDKNTSAIKKKRNELINAEVKLENYNKKLKEIENQLNNTGKRIEEFGTKVENIGSKIEGAGKKVSAFSGATAAAFVASAKSAIDFEDAFTGVEKTVDGTEQQMAELKQGIRDMAKEIPSTTTEISAVAEAAGQLGIKTENILSFSKAMIDLGNSTNLTADEAASQLAKFANITQMSQKDFDKLGSSIVDLGNNFATTEADIVNMAMRLAGAGHQVGMSEGQILGLATALSSVGIEAEMGGSAISKAMVKMQNAVEQSGDKLNNVLSKTGMSLRDLELLSANNSKDFKALCQSIGMTSTEVKQLITAGTNLEDFAAVSGMTAEQFKKAWKEDAAGALSEFIKGLGNAQDKGESAITMLSEMGLTEVRLRDSLLRAANAGTLFNDAIETGTKAWEDNTALTNEANKRYGTLKSQITIAMNKIKDLAITIGNKLMPYISKMIDGIENVTKWFANLSDAQVNTIVKIGALVTAIGPLLTIFGKITSVAGGGIKAIGTFTQAIGVMKGTVTTSSTAINGLAGIITSLSNPTTLAVTAVGVLTAATMAYCIQVEKEKSSLDGLKEKVDTQRKSWEELSKTRNESLTNSNNEIDACKNLVSELKSITDENGKVKDGYKERAQVILTELNSALGTEYKLNGNIIDRYKELKENIDKVIATKKAESVLNAYQTEYGEAIKKEAEATETLIELKKKQAEASEKMVSSYGLEKAEAERQYNSLSQKIGEQTELVGKYGKTIMDYENLQKANAEGNADAIEKATNSITTSYEKAKSAANNSSIEQINSQAEYVRYLKESLQEATKTNDIYQEQILDKQLKTQQQKLDNLVDSLVNETSKIKELTPEQIQAWKNVAEESYSKYSEGLSKVSETTKVEIEKATGIVASDVSISDASSQKADEITTAFGLKLKMSDMTKNEIAASEHKIKTNTTLLEASQNKATEVTDGYSRNLNLSSVARNELRDTSITISGNTGVEDEARKLAGRTQLAVKSNNSQKWGEDMVEGIGNGISKKGNSSWFRGKLNGLASKIASYLHFSRPDVGPLREYEKWMPDMVEGLSKTLDKSSPQLINSVKNMSQGMVNELENKDFKNITNYSSNSNRVSTIDYDKMANSMLKALTGCKFTLDEDGFAKLVKDEMYKVV